MDHPSETLVSHTSLDIDQALEQHQKHPGSTTKGGTRLFSQDPVTSEAVRRAIARGKDASRGSIVSAIQTAEQNILAAIQDLKQTFIKNKTRRSAGPPFF